MKYAASTGGFYDIAIHGGDIPADAVDVTRERHQELLTAQSQGKRITADANGQPIAVDPPSPTEEDLAEKARSTRDALLAACDWVVVRAQESDQPVPAEWAAYRQQLRDVPSQLEFPMAIDWPAAPDGVVQ